MTKIAEEWRSIGDYCKHTYLKYPIETMQTSNGNTIKYVTDTNTIDGKGFVVRKLLSLFW